LACRLMVRTGRTVDTLWVDTMCVISGDTRVVALVGFLPGMRIAADVGVLGAGRYSACRIAVVSMATDSSALVFKHVDSAKATSTNGNSAR
jgi:hypothetical protein